MPSYKHELLADLFERSPDLAWRIMAPLVGLSLEDVEFECKSEQLPELREFRPDRLALVRAKGSERTLAAAVIEVQLKWSDDKPSGWLCHLALAAARYQCPVYLLVVTDRPAVARRATGPFAYGHPGLELRPLVLRAENVPEVVSPAEAAEAPELAVLSVLAHRRSPRALDIAYAAALGTAGLGAETMQAYVDLLLYCLTKTDRERLVVMLQKSREPLSDVFKANFREGRKQGIERGIEQGIERGIEQGIERGIEQGRAETRREWAEAILQMLALRGIAVDSKSERRIRAGSSTALSEWSRRAAFVRDVGELFA